MIIDLVGKGNRTRSIPIPTWALDAVNAWVRAAAIQSGFIFLSLDRHILRIGRHKAMTPEALFYVVRDYSNLVSCHDLRRSFAKLSYQGGASLDQIQMSLGHASMATTERYLGSRQSFTDAPADHLGL